MYVRCQISETAHSIIVIFGMVFRYDPGVLPVILKLKKNYNERVMAFFPPKLGILAFNSFRIACRDLLS